MQSRSNYIEELRKVLKLAKTDLYINGVLNRPLFRDLLDTLSIIGTEKLYALSNTVYDLLDSSDEDIREEVVTTLGLISRLHLPEFKERAYKIWLEDEDANVRKAALCAWKSYYAGTKNPAVLRILYKILKDETYPVDHRRTAMQGIFSVTHEPSNFYDHFQSRGFYMLKSHEELNQKIDWDEIKTIMKKYAPDAL